ncbi:type I restriction-modification system subunit M N-terminal domain-containing protein [Auritidibacter ignavus]|uniref:site-specific DNA-methyltransferase (adenine-specific) n=2 Tax=Auritidibacter ignavus TaxID=678932 RepID=A0AAJ6AI80_9MICC|nr:MULTISPECIES: type I restriction-modification system subunit M N-terminal domain-containing protein [Auritidibacter]WGH93187.1 type I restriction-modification system subunit M N-terminal domain-containing protein [Auritidibacter ignavus]
MGEFDALFERNRVVSIRGVAIEDETECACPENVFGQYVYRRDFSPKEACSEGYSEEMIDWEVQSKFGLSFFNSSRLNLTTIAKLDDHVYDALMDYVGAFSSSVRDVLDAFDFAVKMKTLDTAHRLWPVVKHFATIDMSMQDLPDAQMGDLFQHVMYKAFDTKGKAAGAFYTPRDAIRLMVDILFASEDVGLTSDGASRTVYDQTNSSRRRLEETTQTRCSSSF